MFLLLPVYALILKLLYNRRDWYYTEHLVFGLHTHAFVFITFTIARLLSVLSGEAVWAQALAALLILYAPFYTLIAQKHVYRQRWLKTIVKSFLLGNIYGFVLFLGALVTLLLAATV